ncbi:hypothetical protein B0A49_09164 [Cryomyces minteri]|uniref:Methyltransferase domain-containing protein n=1 Tax=Cryomyces minteri TaxID=331657 RepID=A0A4V5NFU2_9PEZI|nr:hypothetical protein B0A49_09164 [Cryomyces minteri]
MAQETPKNNYLPGYDAKAVAMPKPNDADDPYKATPKLTLLDIGAGSGTIIASLAGYIPDGHVTATDISDQILTQAAEHAKSVGVDNISFQPANAYDLPFSDDTFDVVHARQVLVHLESPLGEIKEMLRVVKPGGMIALRECDLRMWSIWPETPALMAFHKRVLIGVHDLGVGSIDAGAKLVSWAIEAGVRIEQMTATWGTGCYSTPAERQVWECTMAERTVNSSMGRKAVRAGLIA